MLNKKFFTGLCLIVSTNAFCQTVNDNRLKDFSDNLREARSIKEIDISDEKVYILNEGVKSDGIWVSETKSGDDMVANTNFTNTTLPHQLNFNNLEFANRPLWSVNKEELFCIVDKGNDEKAILYTNNADDEVNCDWIEITKNNYENASGNKNLNCLWYSNDDERVANFTDYFKLGEYDKRVFVGNQISSLTDEILYKTDDIFKKSGLTTPAIFNGVYWLENFQDIFVNSNADLTFNNSMLFFDSEELINQSPVKISVNGGVLSVTNSTLSSTRQDAPHRTDDTDDTTSNDWQGVRIQSTGTSSIAFSGAKVSNSKYGIYSDSNSSPAFTTLSVDGSEFRHHENSAISLRNCVATNPITVTNNNFSDFKQNGIEMVNCSTESIEIDGNVIDGDWNSVRGIRMENNQARIEIKNNEILNNPYGIEFGRGYTDANLTENLIQGSLAEESYIGVHLLGIDSDGIVKLTKNTLSNYPIGVKSYACQNSALEIGEKGAPQLANQFYRGDYSFYFERNQSTFSTKIRSNTAHSEAKTFFYVEANNNSVVDAGTGEESGENSFDPSNSPIPTDASGRRVENHSLSTQVLAEGNYWGISAGNGTCGLLNPQNYFVGSVDFCNPLFEKPDELPKPVSQNQIPETYSLSQNYPNPFNPVTTIKFAIPKNSTDFVTLKIYNTLGQEITTLVNEIKQPGFYSALWNGTDKNGNLVGSGVYFYRINAGKFTQNKKMLFLK